MTHQAYAQSDERLGKLVSAHYNDLTTIVKVFSQVSSRIGESKDKVRRVKDNLTQCKMLLQVQSHLMQDAITGAITDYLTQCKMLV